MGETLNQRWAATIVGALVAGGLRHVVICPGSRSTPLALAFVDRPELRCWSIIDERSAAFFALGLSKATGVPAAVLCTSGTAGAHFLPAVMESLEGGTPLVVVTCDRPWELHGFGAPQTIPQVGLFGRYVRAAEALASPSEAGLTHVAAVVARLNHLAQSTPRGPVHLNVPFAEPLAPVDALGPVVIDPSVPHFASTLLTGDGARLLDAVQGAQRGLIVCGPREYGDDFGSWVHQLGERLGFPVVAEAASNARFGFPTAISSLEILLRQERFAGRMKPDVVLRFGGGLTGKVSQAWLDASPARIFQVSDEQAQFDPLHRVESFLPFAGARLALGAVSRTLSDEQRAWQRQWYEAQRVVKEGLAKEAPALNEPLVAREVIAALPRDTGVFLSSSMPIRDVDAFALEGERLRVFVNRGVNGIDGITSTALGVAAGTGKPTLALLGDVAALHDLSAWVAARQNGLSLTVVVINNDGGGIFHFLPIAQKTPHFEKLFGTPHGIDFQSVAALGGASFHRPADLIALRNTVKDCLKGGLHLIEVRTRREENVDLHRALYARLAEIVP